MSDISGSLPLIGVSLEAQALSKFGAAVQNQSGDSLAGKFANGVIGNVAKQILYGTTQNQPHTWQPTPYAGAIASGSGGYDPKSKFLFKVTFNFMPAVATQACTILGIANDGSLASQLTFVVKQIDMPKYTFEYEEMNMYNFRTKFLRAIKHEELNFQLYDSTGNQALKFINAYLQILVPASRQHYATNYALENNAMAFTDLPSKGLNTAMRGSLGEKGDQTNILSSMIIDQYYLSRDHANMLQGPNIVNAIKVNSYEFTNPRLTRFEIGDQDHEKGTEPSMVTCSLDFDSMHMVLGQKGTDRVSNSPFLANGDLLATPHGGFGSTIGPGNNGNPFVNMIAGAVGKQVTQTLNSLLSKKGIGGNPGGALLVSGISGALGTNAARTLSSIGNGNSVASNIALPNYPHVSDNSNGSNEVLLSSSSTSSTGASYPDGTP